MAYFPILIDLEKFKPIVIGGGEVATRKVKNLIEFDATPKIIAPEVTQELNVLISNYKLDFEKRKYLEGDIQGFNFVFVATDDATVDEIVLKDAVKFGAIVNFADKPEICNFIMPSYIKRGDLVIAISTGGKAPFLARCLREMLEKKFPLNFKDFVELSAYFRTKLKGIEVPKNVKDAIVDEFLAVKWLEIIEEDGIEYAKLLVNNLIEYYARKTK
ncbi:bifunctional precorrin-2 dehydrogenase/sirohydrochlorin ferrochelatase [Bacteroidetes/Chlorobi group bacterium Naka2016]|jgi:precorrin-2 dehydrogenase/sirohydrochlorin ferrochelatase|nr:MAG: bifunctional precorrin-2 dehydrogenase/sirohydrochlorin ferrochelatase [Bacteroidetes/Chlorobi group bacterium Naka2016]